MTEKVETEAVEHSLDMSVRPAACSCGRATYAGSPTFIRKRHAVHIDDATQVYRPGEPS